jgi:hypothetical protein
MNDNYPDGCANDPSAPWNQPEPIEDTDRFIDKKLDMWDERISDPEYMLEALGEHQGDELKILARLIKANGFSGIHTMTIGSYVSKWVTEYTEPSDADVIEAMKGEDHE